MQKIKLRCMIQSAYDKGVQQQLIGYCLAQGLTFRADQYIMGDQTSDKPVNISIEGDGRAFNRILLHLQLSTLVV